MPPETLAEREVQGRMLASDIQGKMHQIRIIRDEIARLTQSLLDRGVELGRMQQRQSEMDMA